MNHEWCSASSAQSGEPLAGSASGGWSWVLLLEVPGTWAAKAWERSSVPDAAKARIEAFVQGRSGVRIQVVRRPREQGLQVSLARLGVGGRIREMSFRNWDEVASYDLSALAEPGPVPGAFDAEGSRWLVCTHGSRDRCCGTYGMPVWQALVGEVGERAWQTSHVGGHRFSSNVLVLPEGVLYGRVTPDRVPDLVRRHSQHEVVARQLRGLVTLSGPAQAADVFARMELGITRLDGIHVGDVRGEGPYDVSLKVGPKQVVVQIGEKVADTATPSSCGEPPEKQRSFELLGMVT